MEPKPNPFLVASLMNHGADQRLLHLTLATAMVLVLVIFMAAFLLGLWCGRMIWRRHRWSQAAVELKRKARA